MTQRCLSEAWEEEPILKKGVHSSYHPAGDFNHFCLLAVAVRGDRTATFAVDGTPTRLLVPDWAEPMGEWKSRVVSWEVVQDPARMAPAYAKNVPVAWVGTHRNDARGADEAFVFTQLFRLRLELSKGTRKLTLPDDQHIRILAITAARHDSKAVVAAQPFTDSAVGALVHFEAPAKALIGRTAVTLTSPNLGAAIRYTLDGNELSVTSPPYAEPLRIEPTTTVKARAFAPASRRSVSSPSPPQACLHPIEVRFVHGTFFTKGLELEMDAWDKPFAPVAMEFLFHLREPK